MPRETNAAKRERAIEVCERLNRRYGPVECFLDHENPFRLLIAVLLSAQTTDAQVNKVTPRLFAQWPTPEAMAGASVADVADTIKSLGFYKSKAKHAVEAAQMIVADYGGEVPADMKELVKLPGVGRKTANIVLNVGYGIVEGIAVDTHVNRIAHRLMLSPKTHAKEPLKTEQIEMEQSFPYDETRDQLEAIADIKADMEAPKPMDRLLCGDVGFGKTEVALRAAFKCVDSGRQVMVLCPTTILAQQHYETFFERFAPFGLEVEVLSRFRTPAQQKRALKAFAEGTIDVLIGTHRLLSADVNPKNLGLVIIDEEQRFGVQHKEQLKNLREQIDVLTLSATPIPRTMQMATSGVRDMSLITTPPTGRRPVIVHVGEYDPDVVSAAIRLEVGRGGQVYYVSNRVKTIDDAVARVHEAAPEARVGVAHGKMSPREVEDVMIEFATKKIDVLIATTIVESGIDNATANTLIIEDSQRLGLAQLYQLKGRVGRSATQAYAYFMFPGELPLTEEATARLTALSEFQDLGSGMRIAMRDLEIRGAGSLMGAEQHGNLSSVGFDLFTQMLGQAVAEARGDDDAGVEAASVGINLPADYFLSEEYLPAVDQRVLVYRKLAAAEDLESIDEVQEETEAAHGELPLAGLNLCNRARIRIRGERLGLESVTLSGGRITFLGVDVPKKVAFELKTRYGAVNFPKSRKLSVPYKAGAGAGSGLGRGLDANDGTGPVAAALMLLQQLGASDDD